MCQYGTNEEQLWSRWWSKVPPMTGGVFACNKVFSTPQSKPKIRVMMSPYNLETRVKRQQKITAHKDGRTAQW